MQPAQKVKLKFVMVAGCVQPVAEGSVRNVHNSRIVPLNRGQRRDTVAPVSAFSHGNSGRTAVRLLLILALLGLVLAFLVVFARNYIEVDEIELPNLVGMDINAATELLAEDNIVPLAYAETIRNAAIDEVTSQTPPAGTVVRRGRTVSLGVHNPPGQSRAPVLIGLTADQALELTRTENLNLGQIDYAHNDDAPAGIVISQTPEPGTSVDPTVGLQVTVSRGQELPPVPMPDVRGQMLDDAEQRLRAAGFISIGRVATGITGSRPGSVISQEPSAGTIVERNTPVFLGYGLAASTVVQIPSLAGRSASAAQSQLRTAGLIPGSIEYVDEPSVGMGVVVRTVPAAGSYTLVNTPIRLVVNGAPGTVALDEPMLTDPVQPAAPEIFPEGELGSRTVPFDFNPADQGIQSLMEQRYDLMVVVEDDRGERTVLERNLPGGEAINTSVTVYGDALLRMYINGIFYMAWRP